MAKLSSILGVAKLLDYDGTRKVADVLDGGYQTVTTLAARNAIPAARRKAGLRVKVLGDDGGGVTGRVFELAADLTTWVGLATQAELLQRSQHTGYQPMSSVSGLITQFGAFLRINRWLGSATRAPFWIDGSNNELLGADAAPADGSSHYRGHLINWLRGPFFASKSFRAGGGELMRISKWLGAATRAPFWIDAANNELLGADIAPADGVSYYRGHLIDWLLARLGAGTVNYKPMLLAVADKVPAPSAGTWMGMPVYGQSLSVGALGQPVLTTSQPYANLTHAGGVKSVNAGDLAGARALYEDALGENNATGTNRGETICSTAANFSTRRFLVNDGGAPSDFVSFASAPGQGGTPIAGLSKGTAPYNRLLGQVTAARNAATAAGKVYVVTDIPFIQGESDTDGSTPTTGPTYLAAVKQLVDDLNADIKAITGQTTPVHLLLFQTAYKAASQSQIALAQLQAVREHRLIHLVTNYAFVPYNGDKTHSTNVGYVWLGHYAARARYQLIALGQVPDCIMPLAATFAAAGTTIRVKFRTPTRLKLPTIAGQTGWGFKVSDGTGVLTVTGAVISASGDEVLLTVNRALGSSPIVRYALDYLAAANITNGATGDLTDSTTETATIAGSTYSLVHRAPAFQLSAYSVEA